MSLKKMERLLPLGVVLAAVAVWQVLAINQSQSLLPGPLAVARAIAELAWNGSLLKHIVASLFRVTWGYLLAAAVSVPFGLFLGWHRRAEMALNPSIQILRPISPLAWI